MTVSVNDDDAGIIKAIKDLTEFDTDEKAISLCMEIFLVAMIDQSKIEKAISLLSEKRFDRLRNAIRGVYTIEDETSGKSIPLDLPFA